ncbi:MAG: hypothetical protein KBH99_09395 [Syntrophobacteraceae bacterium]|nr:hypothetical protein [Syntrophobacteraceae bacterium]
MRHQWIQQGLGFHHRKGMLLLLLLLGILCPDLGICDPGDRNDLTDKEAFLLYGEFREIQSFGLIAVSLVGDFEGTDLNEKELLVYVRTKFREHFPGVRLEDLGKDSERFLHLLTTRDKTVGNITIRVWVVGKEYPLAYHVRLDAGNFNNPSIWSEEVLGHGSGKTVPAAIHKILDEMMRMFSRVFFQVRGQEL